MTKTSNAQKAIDKLDFETALAQLEAIVGQLEQGQIGLTESLERYESGIKHLKRCYQLLESAEKKVAVLSGMDAQGDPQIVPFSDAEGNSLAEKADRRSQRRAAPIQNSTPAQNSASPPNSTGEDNVDVPGGLF